MKRIQKAKTESPRDSAHMRMSIYTSHLRDLVVNQSYPASVSVKRLEEVNQLLAEAVLKLSERGTV